MKRRSFLAMIGLAPVAAVSAANAAEASQTSEMRLRLPARALRDDAVIEMVDGRLSISTMRSADGRAEINFDAGYITAQFE